MEGVPVQPLIPAACYGCVLICQTLWWSHLDFVWVVEQCGLRVDISLLYLLCQQRCVNGEQRVMGHLHAVCVHGSVAVWPRKVFRRQQARCAVYIVVCQLGHGETCCMPVAPETGLRRSQWRSLVRTAVRSTRRHREIAMVQHRTAFPAVRFNSGTKAYCGPQHALPPVPAISRTGNIAGRPLNRACVADAADPPPRRRGEHNPRRCASEFSASPMSDRKERGDFWRGDIPLWHPAASSRRGPLRAEPPC
jgi:hypothetical protein